MVSPDGLPKQAATWLGQEEESRPYVLGMAQNHTLTLCTPEWKYIEPRGGAAMIPWGPKIETGYSTSPQIFPFVNGEYDEYSNKAAEYPDVVARLSEMLSEVSFETLQ